eukprot:s887_g2.t1
MIWDTIVGRTKGKGPAGSDGVQPDRDLTAIDLARVEIFRRVCFRRVWPQTRPTLAQKLIHKELVDGVDPHLLDQTVRQAIYEDVEMQVYDAVFLGIPSKTYSALREIQPGPKPLRSPTEVMGIKEGLSPSERKLIKEGNEHTEFSAQVMKKAHKTYIPFGVENPEPLNPVSIFSTPWFTAIAGLKNVHNADFDQCRVGCEAKKPTRLMSYRIDFRKLNGQRCNHEVKKFVDAKGNEYSAAHERVAQRRRKRSDGTEEYASKALGNYPSEFCKEIADAISKVNMERAMKRRELRDQEMP